jgi:group I intron endonuclease
MAKLRIAGIYKLTCKVNGKVYIGQSVDILNRWRCHKNDSIRDKNDALIAKAICKYGWSNFNKEAIITFFDEDKENLNHYEAFYIKKFHSFVGDAHCNGYNMTTGGESCHLSQYAKNKISKGNRGKVRTSETIEKLRKAKLGTKQPLSQRQAISVANKGKKKPVDFGDKISKAKKGVSWTQETTNYQLQIRGEKSLYRAAIRLIDGQIYHLDAKAGMCGMCGTRIKNAVKNNTIYKNSYWKQLSREEIDTFIALGEWSVEVMRSQRGVRHYYGKL